MKKKKMKKMIKKVVRRSEDRILDIIGDEIDILSGCIEAIRCEVIESNVKPVKVAEPIQMYTAELDITKDKELVKMIKKIIKKSVKKNVKKYAKETDEEINDWMVSTYKQFARNIRKEFLAYINEQLKAAGIEVPNGKKEESDDKCKGCGFPSICGGITFRPVSEATGPERDLLRSILELVGYPHEDLEKIFNKKEDSDDEDVKKEDEECDKTNVPQAPYESEDSNDTSEDDDIMNDMIEDEAEDKKAPPVEAE